jgi:uncharacterized protein YegP (UPF0339 family)
MDSNAKPKRPCIEVTQNENGEYIVRWVARNGRVVASTQAAGLSSLRNAKAAILAMQKLCNAQVYISGGN